MNDIWDDAGLWTRFLAKTDVRGENECWPWTGKTVRGRGSIWYQGRDHLAPRIALVIRDHRWPEPGQLACHSCDNPNCVNPNHLWWGTAGDGKGRLGGRRAASEKQCRNGHERTAANTRYTRAGALVCRICAAERQARWKAGASLSDAVGSEADDAPTPLPLLTPENRYDR